MLPVPGREISNKLLCTIIRSFLRCSIRPESTVPICLDFGTNNKKLLDDQFYLGLRQNRVGDEEMTAFMDEFMQAMADVFPKLVIQFEVRFFSLLADFHR
jgi:hypothetical protein